MVDILIVLQCLSQCLDKTTLRQLSCIVPAMLAMTGRVTMLGLSRWTEQGGSYRTIQRFFNTTIAWAKVNWVFIRHHLLDPADTILIAAGSQKNKELVQDLQGKVKELYVVGDCTEPRRIQNAVYEGADAGLMI